MANNRRGHRGRGGRPHRGGGGDGRPAEHPGRRGHQRDEPVGRQETEHHGGRILTEGGERGIAAGALGGAHPGASESGSLEAREFGTPQADIPGGVKHLVNAPTVPAETLDKPPRPADYHKEHGVEPGDWEQYELPDDTVGPPQERTAIPPTDMAVPVYLVEGPDKHRVYRTALADRIAVGPNTGPPTRVCNRDQERVMLSLLCDDASNDVRVCDIETDLIAGGGALLSHNASSYTNLAAQNALFALSAGNAASHLSVIIVTETPI